MQDEKDSRFSCLEQIKWHLDQGSRFIAINHPLRFTKGVNKKSYCVLYVDYDLRSRVAEWIDHMGGYDRFIRRYREFDKNLADVSWPEHYPVYVVKGKGQIAEGRNIFMFFPEVVGVTSKRRDHYFGMELINAWEAVFEQNVSPCVNRLFDDATKMKYFSAFCSRRPDVIYLASVFHEVGHRVGLWKVSPCPDPRVNLTKMQVDVMGELSTDTAASNSTCNTVKEYSRLLR